MYLRRSIFTISVLCFLQIIGCSTQVTSQLLDNRTEVVVGNNQFKFSTPSSMTAVDSSTFTEIQSKSKTVLSGHDFKLVAFYIEGKNTADSVNAFIQATQERHPIDENLLTNTPRSVQIYLIDRGHWSFTEFDTMVKAYWSFKRKQWDKRAGSRTVDGVAYRREIEQNKIRTIENSRNAKVVVFAAENNISVGTDSFTHKTITAEGIINIDDTLFALEVNSNYDSSNDTQWVVETTREILRSSGVI